VIESPTILIGTGGSPRGAGPPATEPSAMSNLLPWQGHSMVLSTLLTAQPWCVQMVENALMVPARGWVTTTRWPAKIFPPPTGRADTWANVCSQAGAALVAPAAVLGGLAGGAPVGLAGGAGCTPDEPP
jgi:hypothetical protein